MFWCALAVGFCVWFVLIPTAVERRWLATGAALVVGSTAFAMGLLRRPKAGRGKPDARAGAAVAACLAPAIGFAPRPVFVAVLGVVMTACALVAGIALREAKQLSRPAADRDSLKGLLGQLRGLLSEYGEERWVAWCDERIAAIESNDPDGVRLVLAASGGMGSLDDVVLSRRRGLRSTIEITSTPARSTDEERAANARFLEVKAALWAAASALPEDGASSQSR